MRLGVERGSTRATPSVAVPGFPSEEDRIAVAKLELVRDGLDDWVFPVKGTYAFGSARFSRTGLGADANYRRLEAGFETVWAFKAHRLAVAARAGRLWGDDAPLVELFTLGGVQNLAGYSSRQFIGARYAYGRATYSRQMDFIGLKSVYLGTSLEAGRMSDRFNGPELGTKYSGSLFGTLNTGLGPFTLGLGVGESDNNTFYLFFGKP